VGEWDQGSQLERRRWGRGRPPRVRRTQHDPTGPIPRPTNPNERRPPPSVPLEGEKDGQQSSGHINEMATYLKDPRQESSTTTPIGTPYDETSNIEGPGGAVGGDDETSTLHGDNEGRQQGQEASDEDQEGQETGEGSREVEETTNVDNDSQYTSNDEDSPRTPPEPPPIQTPPPP
jgi:hypothetical protein